MVDQVNQKKTILAVNYFMYLYEVFIRLYLLVMLQIPGFLKFMYNWKAPPRNNALPEISNGAPIHDGRLTDPTTTKIKTLQHGLTMFCLISVISLKQFIC